MSDLNQPAGEGVMGNPAGKQAQEPPNSFCGKDYQHKLALQHKTTMTRHKCHLSFPDTRDKLHFPAVNATLIKLTLYHLQVHNISSTRKANLNKMIMFMLTFLDCQSSNEPRNKQANNINFIFIQLHGTSPTFAFEARSDRCLQFPNFAA